MKNVSSFKNAFDILQVLHDSLLVLWYLIDPSDFVLNACLDKQSMLSGLHQRP